MTKVLLYTFNTPNLICYKISQSINNENVSKLYLGSTHTLIKNILNERYDYVLGLGNYRKGVKNIRIEAIFRNSYRRRKILANGPEYGYSNWDLMTQDRVAISQTVTNGPCNRSAYLVAYTIQENNLKTKFAFLHIPKSFDYAKAEEVIFNYLDTLRGR